jgi:hypothetical protein
VSVDVVAISSCTHSPVSRHAAKIIQRRTPAPRNRAADHSAQNAARPQPRTSDVSSSANAPAADHLETPIASSEVQRARRQRARRRCKKTEACDRGTAAPDAPSSAPFAPQKDLGATWIEYLKANDAAVSTWAQYLLGFETAVEHFGAATDPATLTPEAVAAHQQSDSVMKSKQGRAKSQPTILKTGRALRLARPWARAAGRPAASPSDENAAAGDLLATEFVGFSDDAQPVARPPSVGSIRPAD